MGSSSKYGNLHEWFSCNASLTGDTHPSQVFDLILCGDLSVSLFISSKLHIPQMQNTGHNAQQILRSNSQESGWWQEPTVGKGSEWDFGVSNILQGDFVGFQGFSENTFPLNAAEITSQSWRHSLQVGKAALLLNMSYLHLIVLEAYNGQSSSHDLPIIFIIYGTDPCTVTLKRHNLI